MKTLRSYFILRRCSGGLLYSIDPLRSVDLQRSYTSFFCSCMFGRSLGDLHEVFDIQNTFRSSSMLERHWEDLNEIFYVQNAIWRSSWFRRSSRFGKSAEGFSRFRRPTRGFYVQDTFSRSSTFRKPSGSPLDSEHLQKTFGRCSNFRRLSECFLRS